MLLCLKYSYYRTSEVFDHYGECPALTDRIYLKFIGTCIIVITGGYRLKHNKLCFSLQHGYHANPTTPKLQHTSNQEHTTNVVIQQNSRKLLMMDILMSETCWAHKK